MDSRTVQTFCDTAHLLLPMIGTLAAQDPLQRTAAQDALVRQLRVAAAALNMALMEVPRAPPPLPAMPPPPS